MSNTPNLSLKKILDSDMYFGDYMAKIQERFNDNMDAVDSALANFNVVTVSANYTVTATDQFVNIISGTPVITFPLAASVSTGKVYYVGNNSGSAATLVGANLNINGAANVSLSGNYTMKVVVKSPTEWVAY